MTRENGGGGHGITDMDDGTGAGLPMDRVPTIGHKLPIFGATVGGDVLSEDWLSAYREAEAEWQKEIEDKRAIFVKRATQASNGEKMDDPPGPGGWREWFDVDGYGQRVNGPSHNPFTDGAPRAKYVDPLPMQVESSQWERSDPQALMARADRLLAAANEVKHTAQLVHVVQQIWQGVYPDRPLPAIERATQPANQAAAQQQRNTRMGA
jgi:hypothetical protein